MKTQNRDYILHVRLTELQRKRLHELAERKEMSISDLARETLRPVISNRSESKIETSAEGKR